MEVIKKENEAVVSDMSRQKREAQNKIKSLQRKLNMISVRMAKRDLKKQLQSEKIDINVVEDDLVASEIVRKYNAIYSAKEKLQPIESFVKGLQKSDEKDVQSWISEIAQKSPHQVKPKVDLEVTSEKFKAQPLT